MALESVVQNGTGRNAFIDGFRVGGKTGTAQKVKDGRYMAGNYIVSFIGFMPADNPKIVVYVAIDNPKGVIQYGGTVSAPIAKSILEDAINILKIKKDNNAKEKKYQIWDKKYVKVPNLIGKDFNKVKSNLTDFEIEYTGSGKKIIFQSPKGGERVYEGSKIRLMLGN